MSHRDPYKALPLPERIRLAEQAVIDRDERVHRMAHQLTGRWRGVERPGIAQTASAGLLAGVGSWIVRRALAVRPAVRRRHAGQTRLDLLLQFLPLLLPVLPASVQRWVKPSRLLLGLAMAAPLVSVWQARREKALARADEAALIRRVLQEQAQQAQQAVQAPAPADDDETTDPRADIPVPWTQVPPSSMAVGAADAAGGRHA